MHARVDKMRHIKSSHKLMLLGLLGMLVPGALLLVRGGLKLDAFETPTIQKEQDIFKNHH